MKGITQSIFSSNTIAKGIFKGDHIGEVDVSLTQKGLDAAEQMNKTDPNYIPTDNINHSNLFDGTGNY